MQFKFEGCGFFYYKICGIFLKKCRLYRMKLFFKRSAQFIVAYWICGPIYTTMSIQKFLTQRPLFHISWRKLSAHKDRRAFFFFLLPHKCATTSKCFAIGKYCTHASTTSVIEHSGLDLTSSAYVLTVRLAACVCVFTVHAFSGFLHQPRGFKVQ